MDLTQGNNLPKYEFCLKARPRFSWLVSPVDETCFALSHADGEFIQLTELLELPSRGPYCRIRIYDDFCGGRSGGMNIRLWPKTGPIFRNFDQIGTTAFHRIVLKNSVTRRPENF